MKTQEKIHNTPKLDIKQYNEGERFSLEYDGKIQIITQNLYKKLTDKARRASELGKELKDLQLAHKAELDKLKAEYHLELQRLKNQLTEQKRRSQQELATLKAQANRRLSEQEHQLQRAQALANRQGKGRPAHLTDQHKDFIRQNLGKLKSFGGSYTIKDLEAVLVRSYGYTGGYEPVRAFVSQFKTPRG